VSSPSLASARPPHRLAEAGRRPLRPRALGAYLGGLILGEWLLTVSVPAAAWCFGLLALAVCLGALTPLDRPGAALLPVLAALPVVRLSMVAMPAAGLTPLSRAAAVAVPTLVAVVAIAWLRPRRPRAPRRGPRWWWTQAAVSTVALPLAPLVYVLAPQPPDRGDLPAVAAAVLLAFAVIPEELLYRGLLVPALAGVLHRRAVLVAAVAYAATFLAYGSPAAVAAAFGVAYPLGWLRQRTGSAVGVVVARVGLVLLVAFALPALDAWR
jgi:membrane protease YdiL (CAAX protease family)